MEYIKDKTQRLAMKAACITEMPKRITADDNRFWLKALVLVRRYSGQHSFALAERGATGVIDIVQDFDSLTRIEGIVGIYPYLFLDEGRIPKSGMTDAELSLYYPNADLSELDKDTKHTMMMKVYIDRQMHEQDPYKMMEQPAFEEAPNVASADGSVEVENETIHSDIVIESIEMPVRKPTRGGRRRK